MRLSLALFLVTFTISVVVVLTAIGILTGFSTASPESTELHSWMDLVGVPKRGDSVGSRVEEFCDEQRAIARFAAHLPFLQADEALARKNGQFQKIRDLTFADGTLRSLPASPRPPPSPSGCPTTGPTRPPGVVMGSGFREIG